LRCGGHCSSVISVATETRFRSMDAVRSGFVGEFSRKPVGCERRRAVD
jgi:hypothetical protein